MKEKWNKRYDSEEYIFGKEPNDFLKEELIKIEPGKAIFLGDGEGRNSVYAATLGWQVEALDISEVAKVKAEKLAVEKNVSINYQIEDVLEFDYKENSYDAVVIIFFHVEESKRELFFRKILHSLKVGGKIIMLVYDKDNLTQGDTGPTDLSILYSLESVTESFIDLDFEIFEKIKRTKTKNGLVKNSVVIKFVGSKIEL